MARFVREMPSINCTYVISVLFPYNAEIIAILSGSLADIYSHRRFIIPLTTVTLGRLLGDFFDERPDALNRREVKRIIIFSALSTIVQILLTKTDRAIQPGVDPPR